MRPKSSVDYSTRRRKGKFHRFLSNQTCSQRHLSPFIATYCPRQTIKNIYQGRIFVYCRNKKYFLHSWKITEFKWSERRPPFLSSGSGLTHRAARTGQVSFLIRSFRVVYTTTKTYMPNIYVRSAWENTFAFMLCIRIWIKKINNSKMRR